MLALSLAGPAGPAPLRRHRSKSSPLNTDQSSFGQRQVGQALAILGRQLTEAVAVVHVAEFVPRL
jgi:hypothetical protein